MMDSVTAAALLGVSRTAPEDEIKRAFREQAKKWHPDLNPRQEAEATRRFNQVRRRVGEPACGAPGCQTNTKCQGFVSPVPAPHHAPHADRSAACVRRPHYRSRRPTRSSRARAGDPARRGTTGVLLRRTGPLTGAGPATRAPIAAAPERTRHTRRTRGCRAPREGRSSGRRSGARNCPRCVWRSFGWRRPGREPHAPARLLAPLRVFVVMTAITFAPPMPSLGGSAAHLYRTKARRTTPPQESN